MKLIGITLLSVLSFSLVAQTTLFSEDFEGGLDPSWKLLKKDTLNNHPNQAAYATGWIVTADRDQAEDSVAGSSSNFTPIGTADRWMISQTISLGSERNLLTWKARSVDPSFPESYKVLVSESGDNPEDFTKEVSITYLEAPTWYNHEVDLSEFDLAGKTIRLAFVHNTNDGFILEIDDILVRDEPALGITENDLSEVHLYPNPVHTILYLSSDEVNDEVRVQNLNGQVLFQANAVSSIDFTNFQAGIYFVEVVQGSRSKRLKIVKD